MNSLEDRLHSLAIHLDDELRDAASLERRSRRDLGNEADDQMALLVDDAPSSPRRPLWIPVAAAILALAVCVFGAFALSQRIDESSSSPGSPLATDPAPSIWDGGVGLIVFMRHDAPAASIEAVRVALVNADLLVDGSGLEYLDAQDSLAEAPRVLASDPPSLALLTPENVPTMFRVIPTAGATAEQLRSVAQSLLQLPDVLLAETPDQAPNRIPIPVTGDATVATESPRATAVDVPQRLAVASEQQVDVVRVPDDGTDAIGDFPARLAVPLGDGRVLIQPPDGIPMLWSGGTTRPTPLWSDTASWAGPVRLHDAATINGTIWVLYSVDPACPSEPTCSPTLYVAAIDKPLDAIVVASPIAIGGNNRFTMSDTGVIVGAPDTTAVASLATVFDGRTINDSSPTVPPPTAPDSRLAVDRSGRVYAWIDGANLTVQLIADGHQQQIPLPPQIQPGTVVSLDIVTTTDDASSGSIALSTSSGAIFVINLGDDSVEPLSGYSGVAAFG